MTKTPEVKPVEAGLITESDLYKLSLCITSHIKEHATDRQLTTSSAEWEGEFIRKIASLNMEVMQYRKLKEKLEKEKKK